MNEITSYVFDGSNVRTLVIDGQPYFVGKDVAEILGYANTRDALSKHVDSEDKNTVAIHDGIKRGNPNQTVINESGLYSLILGSKLPQAKEFKHWVTSEVLPAIRKTGAYKAKPKDNYQIPATYGEALQLAATLQTKIEHDAPSSRESIVIGFLLVLERWEKAYCRYLSRSLSLFNGSSRSCLDVSAILFHLLSLGDD